MFTPLIAVALNFCIGSAIGLCTVALVYRARFLRGAIFGGLTFGVVSGVMFWVYTHVFGGGPHWGSSYLWDEDLQPRERILAICVVITCGAALLAGIGGPAVKRKQVPI